jgi:hypothetical protein
MRVNPAARDLVPLPKILRIAATLRPMIDPAGVQFESRQIAGLRIGDTW